MEKIKTAAYCRVSTDKEVQEGSYELQVTYFTDLINANPPWSLWASTATRARAD
jgi:site-specific DNA recombinase